MEETTVQSLSELVKALGPSAKQQLSGILTNLNSNALQVLSKGVVELQQGPFMAELCLKAGEEGKVLPFVEIIAENPQEQKKYMFEKEGSLEELQEELQKA